MAQWDKWFDPWLFLRIPWILFNFTIIMSLATSKDKFLKGGYFKIFIITESFDIFYCTVIEFHRLQKRIGAGPVAQVLLRFTASMSGVILFTHLFGNLFMALIKFTKLSGINRRSGLRFAGKKWWGPKSIFFMFAGVLIYGLAVFGHIFFIPVRYELLPNTTDFWVYKGRTEKTKVKITLFISCTTTLLCQLTTVVFIIITYTELRRFRKSARTVNSSINPSVELRLLMSVFLSTAFSAFEFVYDLQGALELDFSDSPILMFCMDHFFDHNFMMMSVNGPLLFVASTSLRQVFRRRMFGQTTTVSQALTQ